MLKREEIIHYFDLLNLELNKEGINGELYLVGGAVMCLCFSVRPATRDIDAIFMPTKQIRQASARIALAHELPENFLNDAVKAFLSDKASFNSFLNLSHLKVFCATPEYLLAMKCLAMRIGEEFQDLEDIRYLLRNLGITNYQQALEVIKKFYPLEKFPPKTFYALEELLVDKSLI